MSFFVYLTKTPTFDCPQCHTKRSMNHRTWVKGVGILCQRCAGDFFPCPQCHRNFRIASNSCLVDNIRLCSYCYDQLKCFQPTDDPSPGINYTRTQTKRRFGIELESSRDENFRAIHLRKESRFGAKGDCTCSGREFYSPILSGDDGLVEVEQLCQLAEKYGWEVNDHCGYHLHIDVQDETLNALRSIQYAFANLYDIFIWCVDKSRQTSSYCRDYTKPGTIERATDLLAFFRRTERYNYLNVSSYFQHGTFENRLHEGTFDQRAICNWIILNMRVTEAAKGLSVADLKALLFEKPLKDRWEVVKDWIGDDEIVSFYEARMRSNKSPWFERVECN